MPPVAGLLLAAGGGTRAGGPKALRTSGGRSWLVSGARVLLDGGCQEVVVVLGAGAEAAATVLAAAAPSLPGPVRTVVNPAWAAGLSSSLALGLQATADEVSAVLVHLVDLPDVTAEVVARVRQQAAGGPACLARAVYGGTPGHPVLLGRDHHAGVLTTLAGDRGAQAYLADAGVVPVECGDLATGQDVDRPVGD